MKQIRRSAAESLNYVQNGLRVPKLVLTKEAMNKLWKNMQFLFQQGFVAWTAIGHVPDSWTSSGKLPDSEFLLDLSFFGSISVHSAKWQVNSASLDLDVPQNHKIKQCRRKKIKHHSPNEFSLQACVQSLVCPKSTLMSKLASNECAWRWDTTPQSGTKYPGESKSRKLGCLPMSYNL